jgi:hypothetical protein
VNMGEFKTPKARSRSIVRSVPSVVTLLAKHSTLTLATTSASGLPQAAPLYFAAAPDGSLLFVSSATSRHSAYRSAEITGCSRGAVSLPARKA